MSDEFARLCDQAAEAVRAHRLPPERPQRVWGGPGLGETCAVCNGLLSADQLGLEFDYSGGPAPDRTTTQLHVRCYRAWEQVCTAHEASSGDAAWGRTARADG